MLLELFERKEKRASGHNSLLALSVWVVYVITMAPSSLTQEEYPGFL